MLIVKLLKYNSMENKHKSFKVAAIYPNIVGPNPPTEQQIAASKAMAELEIMKAESAKSVAGRNPEVRVIALLFLAMLGISIFGQFGLLFINNSFNSTQSGVISEFVKSSGFMGIALLLIQLIATFTLLFTRNISVAKTITLVAGISFAISVVQSIINFEISPTMILSFGSLAVNFFILRKIFEVYQNL